MHEGLTRRGFVGRALTLGAAAALAPLTSAVAAVTRETIEVAPESLERVAELFAANPIVDFHTHLGIWQGIGLTGADPALGAMTEATLTRNIEEYVDAGVNVVYLDTISDLVRTRIGAPGNKDRDFRGDEAWEDYLRQYAMIEDLLATYPLSVARSVDEIAAINERGSMAAILSTEGAHMVERDPTRLDTLAAQGLRRLQPIHYVASNLGDSQTDAPRFGGLSRLGRDVLERAADLGMLLDLAHASEAVVAQTAELVDKPLALSHTMIKYDSGRYGDYRQTRQRWISPVHARRIANTGGVIGTFPLRAPFGVDTLDAFIEAVKVMVDTVGIEHVAWSTDLGEPVRPGYLRDYRQFPRICARLLESGFSDADLVKFVSGNALRVQAEA